MLKRLGDTEIMQPFFDLVIADGEAVTEVLENTRWDVLSLTVCSLDNDANIIVEVSPDNVDFFALYSGGTQIEVAADTATSITEVNCKYIRFSNEAAAPNTGDGHVYVFASRDARSI